MRPRKPIRVPKYLEPVARRVREMEHAIHRGILLDTPDVKNELLPDGRVLPRFRNSVPAFTPRAQGGGVTPGPGTPGTFTEFYCNASTGSNVNSGSSEGSAIYTCTNSNWNGTTFVFTPTDGSNPVSAGVAIGQFASIYLDGATEAVYIARITNVVNAANGAITVTNSAAAGTQPTTGATGRTIKVGGAWKGPNGGSGFPFSVLTQLGNLTDASGNTTRFNLKSGTSYSITAQVTFTTNSSNSYVVQGYTATVSDGGKATIDAGTNAIVIFSISISTPTEFNDLIFVSSATTGTSNMVTCGGSSTTWARCVFHGGRGAGMNIGGTALIIECEAYACNKSNTATSGGFVCATNGIVLIRCYSHDHTGSNADGFRFSTAGCTIQNCIADSCGRNGLTLGSFIGAFSVKNCDFYNNGGDAISGSSAFVCLIENCNFVKNTGRGINLSSGIGHSFNCGYGSGTMANGLPDALGHVVSVSPINYPLDTAPWGAASTGNFTASGDSIGTGRGVFTETGSGKSGTLGTPNIGAA